MHKEPKDVQRKNDKPETHAVISPFPRLINGGTVDNSEVYMAGGTMR